MSYAKNLKLLLTTRAIVDGGAERVFLTIARRFAARGDDVTMAIDCAVPTEELDETTNPRLVVLGANHAASTFRLAALLREVRPDVALAAVSGSCAKLAMAQTLARTGTPTVFSYHGFEEWRTGRLGALAYYGMPLLDRAASRIVAVSDGLHADLIERWGADPEKTQRIYNPVSLDLDVAAASATRLADRPPLIVAIGRLSIEKGMIDLVDAFARVERPDARLFIGGDGPERDRIARRITELGLDERVRLVGHVEPCAYYRRARVVAVPSRTEAFGLVVAEALAHGLPIVATACAGPREILGDGRWGRIVPIGDADAMARGLEAALDDPGAPEERIARAATFSTEAGFRQWAGLVDAIVDARAA
ncbi:MAG: glycosyltransferase [Phyllobacteriaceae bacterium]|nr:glycosyltransferase [Phyllobacteriaceae bacterium]